MTKYTMEDFIHKKLAVTFDDDTQQEQFLQACHDAMLMWSTDTPINEYTPDIQEAITCGFHDEGILEICEPEWYEARGWEVIPYTEFVLKKYVEVKRPAKAGDSIRLIRRVFSFDLVGDILLVHSVTPNGLVEVTAKDHPRNTEVKDDYLWVYPEEEYVVLEEI